MVEVKAKGSLASMFDELIQRVRTRYTLGYYRSGACADDKEHKLDVRLAPSFGSKGENYMVLSRSGYYCAPKGQVGGSESKNASLWPQGS